MQDYNRRNDDLNRNEQQYLMGYTIVSLLLIIAVLVTGRGSGWIVLIICAFAVECFIYWQNKRIKMQKITMEDEMRRMEKAEYLKDSFMANLSHEIRTPLNAICGMSEMLIAEGHTGKTGEALYNILTSGRRLEGIVSDVLDYSNLQIGKLKAAESVYDFSSVIKDVIHVTESQNRRKKLELIVDCDARIPSRLEGDCEKIRRTLTSVIRCCIQFTDSGYIYIGAKVREESYGVNLILTVKDSGNSIPEENMDNLFTDSCKVGVKSNDGMDNTGLGLAIAVGFTNLMNGFFHMDKGENGGNVISISIPQKVADDNPLLMVKKKEGIKIAFYIDSENYALPDMYTTYMQTYLNMAQGLDIKIVRCQSMTELKYGIDRGWYTHALFETPQYKNHRIYFEETAKNIPILLIRDEKDEEIFGVNIFPITKPYTVFKIADALNGKKQQPKKDKDEVIIKRFVAPAAKVLVVDDNLMNLRVIERLLSTYKLQLEKVQSGGAALEILREKQFDLIFMDHMMPEMDGIETFHAIRKMYGEYYKTVPIVALTANAISGAREMFLKEGFQDYVAKPIEVSQLERVLKKYLPPNTIQGIDNGNS